VPVNSSEDVSLEGAVNLALGTFFVRFLQDPGTPQRSVEKVVTSPSICNLLLKAVDLLCGYDVVVKYQLK